MSDQKIEALEIGLYEDYLEELQKKYYGGINKVCFQLFKIFFDLF